TILSADPDVPVKLVSASRGKSIRAQPISILYARGLVHHAGRFPELEDELCAFNEGGFVGEGSPDRADAAIWAITDLMVQGFENGLGFLEFYRRAVEAAENPGRPAAPSHPPFVDVVPIVQQRRADPMLTFKVPADIGATLFTIVGRQINVGADRLV